MSEQNISSRLPPTTNRGAEITNAEAGIDWLEFSVTEADWNRIAERLTFDGGAWRELDHGALGYAHCAVSDHEIDVMWDERRPEVHVRLTGKACSRLAEDVLLSVVGWVTSQGGGFSRIDVQATVPYTVATVEQFGEAIERGEHVTRVHQAGLTRQLSLRRSEFDRLLGRTLYVGSPTSRRRLRVYDKGIESGGLIEGTRVELQERDEAADECARQLLGSEPLAVVFAGRLAGFIDFREHDGENVTRWRRSAWYERLIGEVGRARAVAPVEDTTPEQAEEWVRRQVSPTFAALARLGMLDVGALLDEGRKRLNPKHQRWLRTARVKAERSEP